MTMQVKRIQCPQCGIVLDVKNSKSELQKEIHCPSCHALLRVSFEAQEIPFDAHTFYAPPKSPKAKPTDGETLLGVVPIQKKKACLVLDGTEYTLKEGVNIIGRKASTSTASLQIATNDKYMSRQHCIIKVSALSDGTIKAVLSNYQNKNTTSVNGQEINSSDEIRLENGNRITMGHSTITFRLL